MFRIPQIRKSSFEKVAVIIVRNFIVHVMKTCSSNCIKDSLSHLYVLQVFVFYRSSLNSRQSKLIKMIKKEFLIKVKILLLNSWEFLDFPHENERIFPKLKDCSLKFKEIRKFCCAWSCKSAKKKPALLRILLHFSQGRLFLATSCN